MKEKYDETELRRNHLTIRFKDNEHKAICHEAWLDHQTASGFVRAIVLNYLEKAGVALPEPKSTRSPHSEAYSRKI